jgi:hypothetical protein
MKTTFFTSFKMLGFILLAICITLLILATTYLIQAHLTSVGWHGMASVSWNG